MCLKMSVESAIGKNISENKPRFVKAVKKIIQKLQTTTGLKKDKYMSMVCNEQWIKSLQVPSSKKIHS